MRKDLGLKREERERLETQNWRLSQEQEGGCERGGGAEERNENRKHFWKILLSG